MTGRTALVGAAVLGALALVNHAAARRAERKHPPRGRFVEVDGVRLHYSDRGSGKPIVLLHGNAVTGDDYDTSGVAERLLEKHRVIIFDRPGFGHSQRPHGRMWTAMEQAELLHKALQQLSIERPVVVGHSWGAIVALSLAARHPADMAGLVLLSGYYFWTLRPDVLLVVPGAVPVLGDILRHTVSPWLGRLMMPLLKRAMFSPRPLPARFRSDYSDAMALRPSQIRASSVDGALMIPGALMNQASYDGLRMPVGIMAGAADKVVFARSARRLQARIPGSVLQIVERVGHMVHHAVPGQVVEMVEGVLRASTEALHEPSQPLRALPEGSVRAA
ncbi:alpha/beta fold hydrolase [Roseicella frigidaeris]|uniref:Alpha/beta hydrolase n=1 Tax=Roseicella frigidaeris TaxID=2230885 RepID=A0A327M496_9PROT|nr:alpha/beta hydrolase [Roseicella frigidaeris]RAI57579.1 alpha/beta hydrolase [Roseicella frigidaeris]